MSQYENIVTYLILVIDGGLGHETAFGSREGSRSKYKLIAIHPVMALQRLAHSVLLYEFRLV